MAVDLPTQLPVNLTAGRSLMNPPLTNNAVNPTNTSIADYYNEPIQRYFEPEDYIQNLASQYGKGRPQNERKYLGALGYALQLGNPNFDPSAYLNRYDTQLANEQKAQFDNLEKANKLAIIRQVVQKAHTLNIDDMANFGDFLSDQGILDLTLRKELTDDFEQFLPSLEEKKFTADELERIRSMRKTARSDVKNLVKEPIAFIRKIEDSAAKVRIAARRPSSQEIEEVYDTYDFKDWGNEKAINQAVRHIALINAYQRMIDEATVREGDVALIQSAETMRARTQLHLSGLLENKKILTQEQVAEMQRLADLFEFNVIRRNLQTVLDGKDVFVTRYGGSTGWSAKHSDIDSDFASITSKSDLSRWQRKYTNMQKRIKEASIKTEDKDGTVQYPGAVRIADRSEADYYLCGTMFLNLSTGQYEDVACEQE